MASRHDDLFERYVATPPSLQNAVDAVAGWTTLLPVHLGVRSGTLPLGGDTRIAWLLAELGDITGWQVLELGPLEGGHTSMIHAAGAARIAAIEANRLAFLRCLVTKELLGLDRARFYLGDFTQGLGPAEGRYDLILAAGVLYHLSDPLALLEALAARTDRLYLWTHVVEETAMPRGDPRRLAMTGRVTVGTCAGVPVRLHERRYHGAETAVSFCGGPRDNHVWPDRHGLIEALGALGFDDLRIAHDEPGAAAGPALSVLARRSAAGPVP
jgi:hypothetical protein